MVGIFSLDIPYGKPSKENVENMITNSTINSNTHNTITFITCRTRGEFFLKYISIKIEENSKIFT